MKRYLHSVVALALVMLTTPACQPQQQAEDSTTKADHSQHNQTRQEQRAAHEQQLRSEKGHYLIKWQAVAQDKVPLNQYFALDIEVNEPLKPVKYPLDLNVNAGMQAHNHGMHTKPVVHRLANQHFRVEGMLFHMPGQWQVELDISRGVIRDSARLEISL